MNIDERCLEDRVLALLHDVATEGHAFCDYSALCSRLEAQGHEVYPSLEALEHGGFVRWMPRVHEGHDRRISITGAGICEAERRGLCGDTARLERERATCMMLETFLAKRSQGIDLVPKSELVLGPMDFFSEPALRVLLDDGVVVEDERNPGKGIYHVARDRMAVVSNAVRTGDCSRLSPPVNTLPFPGAPSNVRLVPAGKGYVSEAPDIIQPTAERHEGHDCRLVPERPGNPQAPERHESPHGMALMHAAAPMLRGLTMPIFIFGGLVALVGLVFVCLGASGVTKFSFFGQAFESTNVGIGAIFIGAAVMVLIGRRAFQSLDHITSAQAGALKDTKK